MWLIPAVSTLISGVEHMTISKMKAVRLSAAIWSRRCVLVRRRVVGQRTQWALMPGARAGTVWNNPQPGHSRSCGSIVGRLAEDHFIAQPALLRARQRADRPPC